MGELQASPLTAQSQCLDAWAEFRVAWYKQALTGEITVAGGYQCGREQHAHSLRINGDEPEVEESMEVSSQQQTILYSVGVGATVR